MQGRVIVSFIVKSDGSIADPKVVNNGTKSVAVETNPASGEKKRLPLMLLKIRRRLLRLRMPWLKRLCVW